MRRTILGFAAAALMLATAVPAHAAVAAAGPGSFAAGFLTPAVVVAQGEGITFTNGDAAPHNFTALDAFMPKKDARKARWCSAYDKGKCPLFWSPTVTAGGSAEVEGLDHLVSGKQYAFFCSIHPNMKGTLIVR